MRESVLQTLGIPQPFGAVLLLLGLIFTLAPYCAGMDFGMFKVPAFSPANRTRLRTLGPIVLVAAAFLHVPIALTSGPATSSADEVPRSAPQSMEPATPSESLSNINNGFGLAGQQVSNAEVLSRSGGPNQCRARFQSLVRDIRDQLDAPPAAVDTHVVFIGYQKRSMRVIDEAHCGWDIDQLPKPSWILRVSELCVEQAGQPPSAVTCASEASSQSVIDESGLAERREIADHILEELDTLVKR